MCLKRRWMRVTHKGMINFSFLFLCLLVIRCSVLTIFFKKSIPGVINIFFFRTFLFSQKRRRKKKFNYLPGCARKECLQSIVVNKTSFLLFLCLMIVDIYDRQSSSSSSSSSWLLYIMATFVLPDVLFWRLMYNKPLRQTIFLCVNECIH